MKIEYKLGWCPIEHRTVEARPVHCTCRESGRLKLCKRYFCVDLECQNPQDDCDSRVEWYDVEIEEREEKR